MFLRSVNVDYLDPADWGWAGAEYLDIIDLEKEINPQNYPPNIIGIYDSENRFTFVHKEFQTYYEKCLIEQYITKNFTELSVLLLKPDKWVKLYQWHYLNKVDTSLEFSHEFTESLRLRGLNLLFLLLIDDFGQFEISYFKVLNQLADGVEKNTKFSLSPRDFISLLNRHIESIDMHLSSLTEDSIDKEKIAEARNKIQEFRRNLFEEI